MKTVTEKKVKPAAKKTTTKTSAKTVKSKSPTTVKKPAAKKNAKAPQLIAVLKFSKNNPYIASLVFQKP